MSIFGSILGGIESVLSGPIGQLGGQLAGQYIQARYSQPAQTMIVAGGPAGTGMGYPMTAANLPAFQAGGGTGIQFPLLTNGGVQAQPVSLQVPQPQRGWFDPTVPSLFEPTAQSARPIRLLHAMNPVTGKMAFWEHCGTPVLWSRDLRTCKRVAKIAARAARSRPRARSRKR